MSRILRKYIDDEGLEVTEYTNDGVNVTTIIRQLPATETIEPTEPTETIEEKIIRLEQQIQESNLVQLEVLATIYEELLMKG